MEPSNVVDFQLIWKRSFANPLFAIEYLDLTNDGLKELTVASLSGLHVLQVSDQFLRTIIATSVKLPQKAGSGLTFTDMCHSKN